jgi:tryptophan-rich sensory protein
MGNAQTTTNEAVLSFFFIFLVVYGLGAAYALHAYFTVDGHVFKCGERPRDRKARKRRKRHGPSTIVDKGIVDVPDAELDAEEGVVGEDIREMSWYESLSKTKGFPGTIAYGIGWGVAYFLLAYVTWRIWINVPAQENVYGIVYLYFAVVHILVIGLASGLLFWAQHLTFAVLGHTLQLATGTVALAMVGLLTFETNLLPSVTLFVLFCIHMFVILTDWICVIILAAMNRCGENMKHGQPQQKYSSVPVSAPAY